MKTLLEKAEEMWQFYSINGRTYHLSQSEFNEFYDENGDEIDDDE